MKKQRMVLLGSLALVILLSVVLIILMISPQQSQSQESSQTDQQQELELLSMTVEQINTISVENPAGGFVLVNREADLLWKAMRRWRAPASTSTI